MAASRAKRSNEWSWARLDTSKPVWVADVVRDGTLQVRSKIIPAVASKYAHEMKAGALFPPLELGKVEGKLFLLDGWHRYEAAVLINGNETVEAVVRTMTLHEAIWAAASANLTQGQGLTSKEKRNVLNAYIKARKHKLGGSDRKSYRDIGKELFIKVGTLYRWMQLDHPALFKLMAKPHIIKTSAEPPTAPDLGPEHKRRASQALVEAKYSYDSLRDPEDRFRVIEEVKDMLVLMEQEEHSEPWETAQWGLHTTTMQKPA